jgi:hypothetical protein
MFSGAEELTGEKGSIDSNSTVDATVALGQR